MEQTKQAHTKRALGTPRNVPPEHLARSVHKAQVWGSLFIVWLVSLLPWRLWPGAPDMLLLIIAFWCVYEPRQVGMLAAFGFGLLLDVHDAALLGEHALAYTLVAYGALALHRRLQRFDLWRQAMHMLPLFFFVNLLTQVLHAWLVGRWTGWQWVVGVVLSTAIWPLAGWVLHLSQRELDDVETASA